MWWNSCPTHPSSSSSSSSSSSGVLNLLPFHDKLHGVKIGQPQTQMGHNTPFWTHRHWLGGTLFFFPKLCLFIKAFAEWRTSVRFSKWRETEVPVMVFSREYLLWQDVLIRHTLKLYCVRVQLNCVNAHFKMDLNVPSCSQWHKFRSLLVVFKWFSRTWVGLSALIKAWVCLFWGLYDTNTCIADMFIYFSLFVFYANKQGLVELSGKEK